MSIFYVCKVKSCPKYNQPKTDQRDFIFKHYSKHSRVELNDTAIQLGVTDSPYSDNRYHLINRIIHKTIPNNSVKSDNESFFASDDDYRHSSEFD